MPIRQRKTSTDSISATLKRISSLCCSGLGQKLLRRVGPHERHGGPPCDNERLQQLQEI